MPELEVCLLCWEAGQVLVLLVLLVCLVLAAGFGGLEW